MIRSGTHITVRPDLRPRGANVLTVGRGGPAPTTAAQRAGSKREREAPYGGETLGGAYNAQWQYVDRQRLLTTEELMQVYRLVPDVRFCIDQLARVVSTYDWSIKPSIEPTHRSYKRALRVASEAQGFLSAPNSDGETFQDWASQCVRDLGIFDALASENVYGRRGRLEEMVPVRGGDVVPIVNHRRRLLQYAVHGATGEVALMDPDQLLYMNLFPNTSAPGGTPIIETIALEWAILLQANQHLMRSLDKDQWGRALLVISGVADAAMQRLKTDFESKEGEDHVVKMIGGARGADVDAKIVRFDMTPKEVAIQELWHEVRRTVWRLFGVKPVTAGDSESTPRATAEVQLDAESSQLIQPTLELLAAKLNARTIPLIVGKDDAWLVEFGWDVADEYSPEDEERIARANGEYLDRGVISINEVRDLALGLPPRDGGDEPTFKTGSGPVPISKMLETDEDPEAEESSDGQEDPEGDAEDTEPTPEAGPGSEAGGKASRPRVGVLRSRTRRITGSHRAQRTRARYRSVRKHAHDHPMVRASSDLPSDWQPEGRFRGYRTLDLGNLGDVISDYRRDVEPLYRRARLDTLSIVGSALASGPLDSEAIARVMDRIGPVLDRLSTSWETATSVYYREAARIGRSAASDFSGMMVVENWRDRGDAYGAKAMHYLRDTGGILSDLRLRIAAVLRASTLESVANARREAARDVERVWGTRTEDEEAAAVITAVAAAYDANEHRIDNWSGRLVELASATAVEGLREADAGAEPDPESDVDADAADPWLAEWVGVGDRKTCPTCLDYMGQGFIALPDLHTVPGGDTECRGNDRCVLVFWRQSEIDGGSAVALN